MVAPGRFELPSPGPEPGMLVHYTTGLFPIRWDFHQSFLRLIFLYFKINAFFSDYLIHRGHRVGVKIL